MFAERIHREGDYTRTVYLHDSVKRSNLEKGRSVFVYIAPPVGLFLVDKRAAGDAQDKIRDIIQDHYPRVKEVRESSAKLQDIGNTVGCRLTKQVKRIGWTCNFPTDHPQGPAMATEVKINQTTNGVIAVAETGGDEGDLLRCLADIADLGFLQKYDSTEADENSDGS